MVESIASRHTPPNEQPMAQSCRVCIHKNRKRIEAMYIHHPMREIAAKTGISMSSLGRHKAHMKKALARLEVRSGLSLRDKFDALVKDASDSLEKATTPRDRMGWHGVLANWMNLAYKLGIEEARRKEMQQVHSDVTPAVLKMIEEVRR